MAKNYVTVDIGTSETRVGADGAATLRIPNNCVFLDEPTPSTFPAGEGVLGSLEAVIEGLDEKPITVLFGEMAARYPATNLRPSPLEAKYKQDINIVSIIVGAALVKLEKGSTSELFLALPPIEVPKARKELKKVLGGEYRVEFPKLNRAARVKFDDIHCYEESRMAGKAFMTSIADEYKEGTVLSVDIGAGTTDLALFIDGIFYEKSAKTYRLGGNTAREYLIDEITVDYDYELPPADADVVIESGLLKLGNKKVGVVDNINNAKEQFAETLVGSIQQYFRAVGVPIQTVNAFLVSGGGSLASGGEGARSVASYVVEALKEVCDGIDTIEYKGDARLANLEGLSLEAKGEEPVKPVAATTIATTAIATTAIATTILADTPSTEVAPE